MMSKGNAAVRPKVLRLLGVMVALTLIASVAFSGGALAHHTTDQAQDSDQSASIEQSQSNEQLNRAIINFGDQVNYNEQFQYAEINQSSSQAQS